LIFVLNIVRISLLVLLGHAGLEPIAIYGFHSQAGWIAFNCAAGFIVYASRKSPALNRNAKREVIGAENPTATYLVPFLAILAAGMLAAALSSGFEVLYLLRPLAAGLALSIPLAVLTAWPKVGAAFLRAGIGRLPEETAAPVGLQALALPAVAPASSVAA